MSLLATLLMQVAVILALSRLMGMLFARFKQPQVIGEILAGIMLGPTLLGWTWPWAYKHLFVNDQSVTVLNMVASLGVLLFLFLVGLEFDPRVLNRYGKTAAAISISGILVPFTLGFAATYSLRAMFHDGAQGHLFPTALFMGAAMSVTAFPVLARIVTERNLQKTDEGGLAIAAAAIDDVLAWSMLAVVVAVAGSGGEHGGPGKIILLAAVYVAVMWLLVRPFLRQIEEVYQRQNTIGPNILAVLLLTMLLSAFATEEIGVHALFGAFVAGLVMPKKEKFVHDVTLRLEGVSTTFLLPTFFAFAGLKADLRQMLHWDMFGYMVVIICIAVTGKLGCAAVAAWMTGLSKRKSLTLGVLMNTRGLMELIILTIGLQLGVIDQRVYGIMVIMAIVTTAMAAPLIELLLPRIPKKEGDDKIFSLLIPVANPRSGMPLMEMAAYLTQQDADRRKLYALHLSRPTESEMFHSFEGGPSPEQRAELEPLLQEAAERNLPVEPMSYFSRDVPSDIARIVRQQNIDLVLMGYHAPVWGRALLGGIVHRVMAGADCDVAVFVDRDFTRPTRILVPFIGSSHDKLAVEMAGRIAKATEAAITIIHVTNRPIPDAHPTIDKVFKDPTQKKAVEVKLIPADSPAESILSQIDTHDLVVIGVGEEWGLESSLIGMRAERIAADCPASLLIVRRYQPQA